MKYLTAFMAKISTNPESLRLQNLRNPDRPDEGGDENFHESPDPTPTEPTKPHYEGGSVGFVGVGSQENGNFTVPPSVDAIPDRSVWRSVVAGWSIPRRQEWADLAERHQVAGKDWREAEWLAFEGLMQELPL